MDSAVREQPRATPKLSTAPRVFSVSMLISGIRCAFAYVLLPFATPFLGLAPGVGPALGMVVGLVAIAANLFSMRRFWRLRHPWRKPVTVLHVGVIGLLLVLLVFDISRLAG
ncbi:MAG: hypothetical protein KY394_05445 [Actinobacteria bacterium]|nr:hypothetical protein [Actinomycetota bacterium]